MSFSSSSPSTSSNTSYRTKTQNLNLQNLSGGAPVVAGNKGNVTVTDNGAVKNALSTVEATNRQAFQFAQQLQGNVTAAERQAIAAQADGNTAALAFAKNAMTTAAASQRSDSANTMTTLIKYVIVGGVVVGIAFTLRAH